MAKRTIPPADLERARKLLNDGVSMRQVSKETGISRDALKRRYGSHATPKNAPAGNGSGATDSEAGGGVPGAAAPPPRPLRDPPPQPRTAPARTRKNGKPSDEQLQKMLTKIAIAPAIPAGLILHCGFCANHFTSTGPQMAAEMIVLSEDEPELRKMLEWLYTEWRKYAWAGLLLSWFGVPMAHHMLPSGLYRWAAPVMGLPARDRDIPGNHHTHRPQPPAPAPVVEADDDQAADVAAEAAAAVDPEMLVAAEAMFGGMDVGELLGQAEAMGFDLASLGIDPAAVVAMFAGDEPAADESASAEVHAGNGTVGAAVAVAADAADPEPE